MPRFDLFVPSSPVCHRGDNPLTATVVDPRPIHWRDEHRAVANPAARDASARYVPYRTCSYCGSIHPADMIAALDNGGRFEWAVGKVGYKAYVSVPVDLADQSIMQVSEIRTFPKFQCASCRASSSERPTPTSVCSCGSREFRIAGSFREEIYSPVGAVVQATFRAMHLYDLVDPASFDRGARYIREATGVEVAR